MNPITLQAKSRAWQMLARWFQRRPDQDAIAEEVHRHLDEVSPDHVQRDLARLATKVANERDLARLTKVVNERANKT